MIRPSIVLVFAFLAILLACVAGCGGGDDSTATGQAQPSSFEKPLTPKTFTQEVEKACRVALRERKAGFDYINEHGYPKGAKERWLVETKLLPPVKRMVKKVDSLDPPKGEKKVARVMALFRQGISQIEADPSMLLTGAALSKADFWSIEWGLTECGQV